VGAIRVFRVLLVAGGVLFLAGTSFFAGAFSSSTSNTTSIPAGPGWYMYFEFNLLGSGTLRGDYRETTGGTLDLFVLTQAQYEAYKLGTEFVPLWFTGDSRQGTIDVALPGSGKYFMVADHGRSFEGIKQDVHLALSVSGIDPPWFASAVGLLGGGLALIAVGIVKRRRFRRSPAAQSDSSSPLPGESSRPPEPPQPPIGP